ncbi:MAG: DUF2148 domain-containing protein [Thermodesulfobacteriota bacterium]
MEDFSVAAQLMALSAITAPKSKGQSYVATKVLAGPDLEALAKAMEEYGPRYGKKDFDRDARGVLKSFAVVLIGIKDAQPVGLNCGACGYSTCNDLLAAGRKQKEFVGPVCAFRLLDMGIALGSAVKTASLLNVDNRIMYRVGVVARERGIVDWDFVMGIPLSATGKNVFFDR